MNNIVSNWFSRRKALTALGLAASGSVVAATQQGEPEQRKRRRAEHRAHRKIVDTAVAKQQIAELRCRYAVATDLIGTADKAAVAKGRSIYHDIFRPDAIIAATGVDTVTGPDAWVDIVLDALKEYKDTQHLIGTQLVDIETLPGAADQAGKARMTSYLQAWHAKADGELWLFIGTYTDALVHSNEHGWQIANMDLQQVSGETRQLDS